MEEETRTLTFGEKAVGLTFNPSGDEHVISAKRAYAAIIDNLNDMRNSSTSADAKRHYSLAITYAEDSQMRAVRAITWKD